MQLKSRRRQVLLACTIVAFVFGASIAGSVIDNRDSPSEPEETGPAEDSVDMAVEFYALDYSVTQEEARRRLDRISEIQEALESIRDVEAERVAGWGIDHHNRFGG